jgi:hypothetical protein
VNGAAATDHLRPFQCSASQPTAPLPTAQQSMSRRQNTPDRLLKPPEGRVATTDHFLPVQCSASGRGAAFTRRAA